MKRREILRYTALATGVAVSLPIANSLLIGCQSASSASEAAMDLQFFDADEFELVKALSDVILPRTDSPSASDVGVPEMIDQMVGKVYDEQYRTQYRANFDKLKQYLAESKFGEMNPTDQLSFLNEMASSETTVLPAIKKAFLDFRQQSIAYYLNTEEIGTQFLNYLPVPGKYESCIALEEVGGKAWAL